MLQISDLDFPSKWRDAKADLDVALWVNGALRGSAVVENKVLGEGLLQATVLASRDARFKPLELNELPGTRIEITAFSDLRIPLSEESIKKMKFYTTRVIC